MLDKYFEAPFTLAQLRSGSSAPWLDCFAQYLHEDGHAWWTARTYLRAAYHLGHFLKIRGVDLVAVQPDTVVEFRQHLKRCRCPKAERRKDRRYGSRCRGFSQVSPHGWRYCPGYKAIVATTGSWISPLAQLPPRRI